MSARGFAAGIAVLLLLSSIGPARAAIEIQWWHAMQNELKRLLEQLATDFNGTQSEYKVVPVAKGLYTETLSAAILALRSRQHPAIMQVAEVATATMMAAKGAVYPVYELMRDQGEGFDPGAFLPAVTGYYADIGGNMLSFPFNSSTPILYYNKDQFRTAGLDPDQPPKTWPDLEAAAGRLRLSGVRCGFTTHWPSWVNVENFSAFHNLPIASRSNGFAGLDTELSINNDVMVRHLGKLVEWQKTRIFDYGGRETRADAKFRSGECGMFLGTSGARVDLLSKAQFEVGYGMLPYWPDVKGAPQNSIIGSDAVGAQGAAGGRVPGRGQVLRPSVAAGRPGFLAPGHRLSSDYPRRLRSHPRARLLRPQSRTPTCRSSRSLCTRRPRTPRGCGSVRSC